MFLQPYAEYQKGAKQKASKNTGLSDLVHLMTITWTDVNS